MAAYWIGYTLHAEERNYDVLYEVIKVIGPCLRSTTSSWIVAESVLGIQDIYDFLGAYIDNTDQLIVAELTGKAAHADLDSAGVNSTGVTWPEDQRVVQ